MDILLRRLFFFLSLPPFSSASSGCVWATEMMCHSTYRLWWLCRWMQRDGESRKHRVGGCLLLSFRRKHATPLPRWPSGGLKGRPSIFRRERHSFKQLSWPGPGLPFSFAAGTGSAMPPCTAISSGIFYLRSSSSLCHGRPVQSVCRHRRPSFLQLLLVPPTAHSSSFVPSSAPTSPFGRMSTCRISGSEQTASAFGSRPFPQ